MEIQLKKGILDIVVLSTLVGNDSYGYKIIQDVSGIIEISESTLYPILRRLEVASLLRTYSMEYNGRLRKYYKINKEGMERIDEFINEWGDVKNIYEFIVSNIKNKGDK